MIKLIALVATSVPLLAQDASAYSQAVRHACRGDYFTHCNTYEVGSTELRKCMRKVGRGLSAPCQQALVTSGEVAKENSLSRRVRH
jgi:hypothetical protein